MNITTQTPALTPGVGQPVYSPVRKAFKSFMRGISTFFSLEPADKLGQTLGALFNLTRSSMDQAGALSGSTDQGFKQAGIVFTVLKLGHAVHNFFRPLAKSSSLTAANPDSNTPGLDPVEVEKEKLAILKERVKAGIGFVGDMFEATFQLETLKAIKIEKAALLPLKIIGGFFSITFLGRISYEGIKKAKVLTGKITDETTLVKAFDVKVQGIKTERNAAIMPLNEQINLLLLDPATDQTAIEGLKNQIKELTDKADTAIAQAKADIQPNKDSKSLLKRERMTTIASVIGSLGKIVLVSLGIIFTGLAMYNPLTGIIFGAVGLVAHSASLISAAVKGHDVAEVEEKKSFAKIYQEFHPQQIAG